MPAARPQNLRVLEGRFVLARVTDMGTVAFDADLLALVLGPDGGAAMRRDDTAEDAWVALWNGDDAHDPDAPLSSRVANAETVRGEAATGRSASMSRSSDRLRSPGEGPRQARPTTPGDPI